MKHGKVEIYNPVMMGKNKNEKYTIYAYYLKFWFLIRKVCIYGIFFIFIFSHHYGIIYLYFSVFQLVSTNCFSLEGSRLSASRYFDTVVKKFWYKKNLVKKILVKKKIFCKKILAEKFLVKKFWLKKKIWFKKKILVKKIFVKKKNLV